MGNLNRMWVRPWLRPWRLHTFVMHSMSWCIRYSSLCGRSDSNGLALGAKYIICAHCLAPQITEPTLTWPRVKPGSGGLLVYQPQSHFGQQLDKAKRGYRGGEGADSRVPEARDLAQHCWEGMSQLCPLLSAWRVRCAEAALWLKAGGKDWADLVEGELEWSWLLLTPWPHEVGRVSPSHSQTSRQILQEMMTACCCSLPVRAEGWREGGDAAPVSLSLTHQGHPKMRINCWREVKPLW